MDQSSFEISAATGGVITVLLVDDDDLVRATLATALADGGFTVIEAVNGHEAIEQLDRSASIDIVVCDILMPDMDGIETLREVSRRWPKLPILMMSGGDRSGWTDALGMASQLGASSTIRKPFTARELIERINSMLGGAKPA